MAPPTAVLMSALLVMPTDPPRPPATPLPPADFLSPLSASPPAPPCPPPLCATMPKAAAVAALTCRVPAGAAPITCEPWGAKQNPASGHAARWSLPVAAAARLVEGRVDLATFEAPASGPVLALARRTAWEPLAGARFPEVFEAEIVAETRDGLRHEIRVDDVYGNADGPPATMRCGRNSAATPPAASHRRTPRPWRPPSTRSPRPRASTPSPWPCPPPPGATHEHGSRPPHPRRRRRPSGRGRTACDIAVRDGRISAILAPGATASAAATLDARGLVVLPGAIDVHLHLGHGRDIARPRVPEDAARESAAAVAGGITCFIPYLMTSDPFARVLPEVIGVTEAGSRIDFGYHRSSRPRRSSRRSRPAPGSTARRPSRSS